MNTTPVRTLKTAQTGVHPRLEPIVRTHLERPWRGGAHGPTKEAFEAASALARDARACPLIFDSGCGTGESTSLIAAAFPGSLVIAIDRSAARLARRGAAGLPRREANIVWVRAELAAFWSLALKSGWRLQRHYLLYPNPRPKASQLRHRWHGHPAFPTLLALGGMLEMRTNWSVYAQEFATAVRLASGIEATIEPVGESAVTSPFERKYRDRDHALYRVCAALDAGG